MKASEKLLLAGGVLLALFGLFMILGVAVSMSDRTSKDSVAGDVAGLIILGIIPLVAGIWLFRHTQAGVSRRAFQFREQTVFHLAKQHQGTLTVPQVVEESGMTFEQAKEVLEYLYHRSFNEMTLSDSGETVYRFQM